MFGGEIKLRFRFEREMFEGDGEWRAPIPVVVVVIEGGPNTVKCALESLQAKIPILVLDVIFFCFSQLKIMNDFRKLKKIV